MYAREETCCFTGHRPEKLPWGKNESDPRCILLKSKIRDAIEAAYAEGKRHFICGMARGCDFYFAEAILALREEKGDVTLEAAIPCAVQSASWSAQQRARWEMLVADCDVKTVLQEAYTPDCMHRRNRYMVGRSSLVIAVYDGSDGGTRRTLEYALREKVPFVDIAPGSGR
ncbi:MAG: DUF1273 family protein [Oscillospiraceae bacterium]|nr:DUF1273 family protein [Oscillospiraceae bacterium]